MKVVTAFVAGFLLATTGTALAAKTYWTENGNFYKCEGIRSSVSCHETDYYRSQQYEVAIIPSDIVVSYGGRVIYGCNRKKRPAYNCESYVPAP